MQVNSTNSSNLFLGLCSTGSVGVTASMEGGKTSFNFSRRSGKAIYKT